MRKWWWIICALCFFGCQKKENPPGQKKVTPENRFRGPLGFDTLKLASYEYPPLKNFYQLTDYKTFWQDEKKRRAAISFLSESRHRGFDPESFHLKKIEQCEKNYLQLSDSERVDYDVLLTYSLRRYLESIYEGQTNLRKLQWNWAVYRKKKPITKLMLGGISGDSLSSIAGILESKHPVYQGLLKALAQLDSLPATKFQPLKIERKIRRGDSLAEIVEVKKRLIFWGDMPAQKELSPVFNSFAIKALTRFQKRHGLPVTGSLTQATVLALNKSRESRRQKILVNLERWRWFPHSMEGKYVIVNIPDYSLHFIKDKDTLDSRRVVVGKAERSTPVLSSTFSEIILNPTWTVPPTIIKEDLGPGAAKDTNYFRNHRLTIYDWKNNLVSASEWDPENPTNYYYVQDPGSDNSLGNVKFNFPNSFTVYLHDTNHRDYFSRHKRSLSSGCVRVEKPLELAELMLDDEEWTLEKINEVVATNTTTSIKLKEKIRIYQLYWTAWLNKDGKIEYRDDIYSLDEKVYKALRPKL